jgi:hypothetical protein
MPWSVRAPGHCRNAALEALATLFASPCPPLCRDQSPALTRLPRACPALPGQPRTCSPATAAAAELMHLVASHH